MFTNQPKLSPGVRFIGVPPKFCRVVSRGQFRFDWRRTNRSKYQPHIGKKQIAKGRKHVTG